MNPFRATFSWNCKMELCSISGTWLLEWLMVVTHNKCKTSLAKIFSKENMLSCLNCPAPSIFTPTFTRTKWTWPLVWKTYEQNKTMLHQYHKHLLHDPKQFPGTIHPWMVHNNQTVSWFESHSWLPIYIRMLFSFRRIEVEMWTLSISQTDMILSNHDLTLHRAWTTKWF